MAVLFQNYACSDLTKCVDYDNEFLMQVLNGLTCTHFFNLILDAQSGSKGKIVLPLTILGKIDHSSIATQASCLLVVQLCSLFFAVR